MLSKLTLGFFAFCVMTLPSHANQASQSGGEWVDLTSGQVAHGVRYESDGKVSIRSNVLATCRSDQFNLHLSAPSPIKKLAALICRSSTGDLDRAYIVDTKHARAIPLKLGTWGVGIWVRWSPDERFALLDLGAEGGPPHLFVVDLRTFVKQEIRFRQFDGSNETQGFDPDSISWTNNYSFQVQLAIYGGGERLLRKHVAHVTLNPISIKYLSNSRPRNTLSPVSGADDCKFCGQWRAVAGGRWIGRQTADAFEKTGNPFCACNYLEITKSDRGRYKLRVGFEEKGKIYWTDPDVRNGDSIYLIPTKGRLSGTFVSSNFYATHSIDFTFRITCELKNDSELIFSVWSATKGYETRGGETERATYSKVGRD